MLSVYLPCSISARTVSFTSDIAPLLQQRCVSCHGPDKTKGKYRLDTFVALMKPGSSEKPSVVPGKPEASLLYQLLTEKSEDDRMPQKSEPFLSSEISLVREWIVGGAKFDGVNQSASLASLRPPPRNVAPPKRYKFPWPVSALTYNHDGTQLITGGYHEIIFWNATNGMMLNRIGGMPERVHSLAIQSHGQRLTVAGGSPGRSGELFLLELNQRAVPASLVVTADSLLCTAFSSDGQRLVTGGADKTIRIFSIPTGLEILKLEQHSDWIHGVAFSPDGKWIASASRDRTARIYDSTNGASISTFREHEAAVESILFHDDGKKVLTSGADRSVRSWDSNEAGKGRSLVKSDTAITCLHSDGKSVFISMGDGKLSQRNLPEGKESKDLIDLGTRVSSLAMHPTSGLLAAGTHDGRVCIVDIKTGALLCEFIASPGFSKPVKKQIKTVVTR